jgi:hypothetical protein
VKQKNACGSAITTKRRPTPRVRGRFFSLRSTSFLLRSHGQGRKCLGHCLQTTISRLQCIGPGVLHHYRRREPEWKVCDLEGMQSRKCHQANDHMLMVSTDRPLNSASINRE